MAGAVQTSRVSNTVDHFYGAAKCKQNMPLEFKNDWG